MTSGQESKLSMYLATSDYLTANASIVGTLPNYAGFFTAFKSSITSIQTYSEQQMFDKKGFAVNKNQLRSTLVLLAIDTSRKLTAFAKFTNNQVLLNETKFTESDLKRCPDSNLRDSAQGIYDRAQTNLQALATYGVTAATQTSLQTAITAFVTSIPQPRLGIATKKQSTVQLANFFKSADSALENIDTVIDIIRMTQQNFFNGYKSARKIILTGSGSLTLKGFVTDATSGEPVKGASLSFMLDGNMSKAKSVKGTETLVKKTADKGGYNIKSLPAGVYTVTIKKNGYADQFATVAVTDGELSELNIQLSKN